MANAFVEIQDELRSQYALSYKPADLRPDGRFHTIEILAQNHKGLRVRSRRGYFAATHRLPAWRDIPALLFPEKLGLKPQFRIAFLQLPREVKTALKDSLSGAG